MVELMVTYIFNNIAAQIPFSVIYSHNHHIYASPRKLQHPPINCLHKTDENNDTNYYLFIFKPK